MLEQLPEGLPGEDFCKSSNHGGWSVVGRRNRKGKAEGHVASDNSILQLNCHTPCAHLRQSEADPSTALFP
jgi:hypothetical protein